MDSVAGAMGYTLLWLSRKREYLYCLCMRCMSTMMSIHCRSASCADRARPFLKCDSTNVCTHYVSCVQDPTQNCSFYSQAFQARYDNGM